MAFRKRGIERAGQLRMFDDALSGLHMLVPDSFRQLPSTIAVGGETESDHSEVRSWGTESEPQLTIKIHSRGEAWESPQTMMQWAEQPSPGAYINHDRHIVVAGCVAREMVWSTYDVGLRRYVVTDLVSLPSLHTLFEVQVRGTVRETSDVTKLVSWMQDLLNSISIDQPEFEEVGTADDEALFALIHQLRQDEHGSDEVPLIPLALSWRIVLPTALRMLHASDERDQVVAARLLLRCHPEEQVSAELLEGLWRSLWFAPNATAATVLARAVHHFAISTEQVARMQQLITQHANAWVRDAIMEWDSED